MNCQYINSWLSVALKDVEVSKILHNKKCYSNALYHFQQASEKGLKAYAFMSEQFSSEKDAYKVSHNTLTVFRDGALKQQEKIELIEEYEFDFITKTEGFEKYRDNLFDFVNRLPSKNDVIQYRGKDLTELLDMLRQLKNFRIELPDNFSTIFREKMHELFDSLKKINFEYASVLETDFSNMENESLFSKNGIQEVLRVLLIETYISQVLYLSSLITHNHNNLSRYPSMEFNPLNYYTLRLPLIKMLPKFIAHLKFSLQVLKKLNKSLYHPTN